MDRKQLENKNKTLSMNKSYRQFKKFLNENCVDEKDFGDGKYDKMIYDWFVLDKQEKGEKVSEREGLCRHGGPLLFCPALVQQEQPTEPDLSFIPLGGGAYALVDPSEVENLSQFKWYLLGKYAVTVNDGKIIRMHHMINRTPKGYETDHINGIKLDNRKSNLRTVSRSQNSMNKNKQSNNTSGYKNIDWYSPDKKWRVRIKAGPKSHLIGYFKNIEDAIKARDKAIGKYHGEFASLNVIKSKEKHG